MPDHTLLSEPEAAALLQPYMPSKSAEKWLDHDRRSNPSIPFFHSQGQTFYREADVVAFIRKVLNPAAQFVRIHDQLNAERRHAADRRNLANRRKKTSITLQASIERRQHGQPDRRQGANNNRRSQPVRQQPGVSL